MELMNIYPMRYIIWGHLLSSSSLSLLFFPIFIFWPLELAYKYFNDAFWISRFNPVYIWYILDILRSSDYQKASFTVHCYFYDLKASKVITATKFILFWSVTFTRIRIRKKTVPTKTVCSVDYSVQFSHGNSFEKGMLPLNLSVLWGLPSLLLY